MPMPKSVVPGTFAIQRASRCTASAGAHVISSVVFGSKCDAYSCMRSKHGLQRTVDPSASVTSTEPSSFGFFTVERTPTASRVIARGTDAASSHHT